MFSTIATGFWPRFAQKRLGAKPIDAIDTMLLTTGVGLVVRRDKLLIGAALIALGFYRSWRAAQPASRPVCDFD